MREAEGGGSIKNKTFDTHSRGIKTVKLFAVFREAWFTNLYSTIPR